MTKVSNNVAYIIKRINEEWEKKPGKKILQKMVFLIEEKGIDLGYEYGLHFYGPYSGTLDSDTALLHAEGIIDFHYSGYSHLMGINEDIEVNSDGLSNEQKEEIDKLLNRFKGQSPSYLELLTTAIYAYNHLEDRSKEIIIGGVKKIKGSKYSREQIEDALEDLVYFEKHITA